MNKDNIRLWVDALRSGDYAQGSGGLAMTDSAGDRKFCCLGVACEVAIKNGLDLSLHQNAYPLYDGYGEENESGFLPEAVKDWLGVDSTSPRVWTGFEVQRLAHLNDEKAWGFEQIADALEATYLPEEKK